MRISPLYSNVVTTTLCIATLLMPCSAFSKDWVYTVVQGDNLWNFSELHLDSVLRFEKLRTLNNIQNPKRMKPGSKIRVPLKWVKSNPVPAEVVAISGTAQLIHPDNKIDQISAAGTLIKLGDRIKTGSESSIAIKFADNSILTLHANSLIQFNHLSAHGVTGMVDSRLHLLEGRIDTRVTPATGPGSRFEIHTPSAISAVRGTEYRAAVAQASHSSNIEVLHGKVAVKGGKKQRLVNAGFGTRVEKGKQPIKPRKLLKAPSLNPFPERIRILNQTLSWKPVKSALRYRTEISDEENFNTIIWQKTSDYPKVGLPDLLDGNYFIRVRGIDNLGLEGRQLVSRFVMDTRPQPPVQLKPSEGKVFRGKTPQLQWTNSAEAARYQLEIANDEDFTQLVVNLDGIDKTHFDTSKLSQTNKYYWRLTSIAPDGEYGPVGSTRSYEVKPMPEKISASMDVSDDGNLSASWRPGSPGQSYQVQMAYDSDFKDMEFDKNTSKPSLSFKPIIGQFRYLRIRGIEADGYQGPWGAVQRIDPTPDKSIWAIPLISIIGILLL